MACRAQAWHELQAEEDPSAVDPLAAATRRVLYSLPQQARPPTLPCLVHMACMERFL